MIKYLIATSVVVFVLGAQTRPDIYGLINILYLKADGNVDGTITSGELSEVFKGFDKNGDGTVTNQEFVELWKDLTGQTDALADAYFHLADLNDDKVINDADYPIIYGRFDSNQDGKVTAQEFVNKWEDIIRETPFVVLFQRSDKNHNEILDSSEFAGFFSSFSTTHNGQVNNADFDAGWSHADFALLSDADMLFRDIDNDGNGVIDNTDMSHLFSQYDKDGNQQLTTLEVIQMKDLLSLQTPGAGPVGR